MFAEISWKTTENMQILNTWVTWLAWLQNEPLFELKELSKEEKQHLNCKTEKKTKQKKTLLKHLINYFPLKKKHLSEIVTLTMTLCKGDLLADD